MSFSKSKSKRFQENLSCAPGVGTYDVKVPKTKVAAIVGKDERFKEPKEPTPGPAMPKTHVFASPLRKTSSSESLPPSGLRRSRSVSSQRKRSKDSGSTSSLEYTLSASSEKLDELTKQLGKTQEELCRMNSEKSELLESLDAADELLGSQESKEELLRSEVLRLQEELKQASLVLDEKLLEVEEGRNTSLYELSVKYQDLERIHSESKTHLETTIHYLESQIYGYQATSAALQSDLDSLRQRCMELMELVNTKENQIKSLERSRESEKQSRKNSEEALEELKGQYFLLEEQHGDIQYNLQTAKEREQELKDNLVEMGLKKARLEEEVANLVKEKEDVFELANQRLALIDQQEEEVQDLREELHRVYEEVQKASQDQESIKKELSDTYVAMETKIAELEGNSVKMSEEYGRRLVETQKKISLKTVEMERYKNEKDEEIRQLSNELVSAKRSIREQTQEFEEIKIKKESEISEAKQLLVCIQNQMTEKEEQFQTMKVCTDHQLQDLESEMSVLKASLEGKQREFEELKSEMNLNTQEKDVEISALTSTVQTLSCQVTDLTDKVSEKEDHFEHFRTEMNAAEEIKNREIDALSKINKELESHVDQLKDQAQMKDNQLMKLEDNFKSMVVSKEKEMESLVQNHNNVVKSLTETKDKLQQKEEELALTLNNQHQKEQLWQQETRIMNDDINKLSSQVSEMKHETAEKEERFTAQAVEFQETLDAKQREMDILSNQVDFHLKEVKNLEEVVDQKEKALMAQAESLKAAEKLNEEQRVKMAAERQTLQDQIGKLSKGVEDRELIIDSLQEEHKRGREREEAKQTEVEMLSDQVHRLSNEKKNLEETIDQKNKMLTTQVANLESAEKLNQEQLEKMTEEKQKLQGQMRELLKEFNERGTKLESLQGEYRQLELEKSKDDFKLKEHQVNVASLKDAMRVMKEEIETRKDKEEKHGEEIKRLTGKLLAAERDISTQIARNEELEGQESWKIKYEELLAKIEPFQEQLDQYEAEKKFLLDQNNATKSDLTQLSRDYAKLLGHQNNKQKIHHVAKLKDDNFKLKEEVKNLQEDTLKKTNTIRQLREKLNKVEGKRRFDPSKAFQHKENQRPALGTVNNREAR